MEVSKLKLPWADKGKLTNVCVYKKSKSSRTYYMLLTDHHVDIINNARATKPLVDHKYEIIELGIGSSLIKSWADKYKIKKPQIVSKY
tara:strand:+ start:1332 stop:1595 length:264 start_codon:yes stop_codon:yes gene_type:complete